MAEGMTWSIEEADKLTQAEVYGQVLTQLGEKDPKIIAMTADLAKSTKIGNFGQKFPERFINMGIAENSLFGVAAGLALADTSPWCPPSLCSRRFAAPSSCERISATRTSM